MSADNYALLPCNGLDKGLGQITRAAALMAAAELPGLEILCPVVLSRDPDRYTESIQKKKIIAIDGCGTRCATKTAATTSAGIALKVYVPDIIRSTGRKPEAAMLAPPKGGEPGPGGLEVAQEICRLVVRECTEERQKEASSEDIGAWETRQMEFHETMVDKFIFRVPKEGYLYNENDCWAYVRGTTAFIGISDYLQTHAGDVMYVGVPDAGKEIGQFDEAGDFESSKAVLQVISPLSGVVVRTNDALKDYPELLNEDPYRRGWIAELRLTQLDDDRELLLDGDAYFAHLVKKAEKEIAGTH